ncbi:hypothetical protein MMC09_001703 [Bachmanniomyces sp. S44760]|nr:hypothetical protein [Bachmanniomyces sp. S44760]
MPPEFGGGDHVDAPHNERSPLLRGGKPHDDNANERGEILDDEHEDADQNSVPLPDEASTAKLLAVMSSTWAGSFLAALDSTVVATLSAPISASFHSLSLLSWLASAYFIANAALQPLSGKLTDIFSRRTGLVISNILFGVGNLICGLAQDEWVMIFGRVVAGMGGGGLTAISTFVGSDLVPLRKRGVWQGFGNISYGIGAGLGGFFGGRINDSLGWRAAFLMQVPLTCISGLMVFFLVKIPTKKTEKSRLKRIDYLGALSLISTLILLLLGINSGGNVVPWTHPLVLITLPLSFVCLLLFIYIESSVAVEPVIPVRLLLNRTVLASCLTNWFITMAVFALLFYGPIYFQVQGMSTTQAGIRLIPQSIGTCIGSVGTGLIMRWLGRYYVLNIFIQLISIAAFALVSTFTLSTPVWAPFIYFLMVGIGYSGMLTVTLLALISAVDHAHQAVITSASYAFRSTGSTIGITVASAVFQNILNSELGSSFGDRDDASTLIPKIKDSIDAIRDLPDGVRDAVRGIYMDALSGVFTTTLGIALLGATCSLFMREHKLHDNLARK